MTELRPDNVGLDEDDRALRDLVRTFAEREVRPVVEAHEAAAKDPAAVYAGLAALGVAGIPFPEEFGGAGRPYRSYLLVIEELAHVWVAAAVGLGVHTLVCDAVQRFAGPELKEELLPALLAGERLGAYALTESSSGSDAASLQTRAVPDGGGYRLTGRKQFCTRGAEADVLLVMARTGAEGAKGISAFLVDQGAPGFRPAKVEQKMGLRASPTWELLFEDCPVPAGRRLGAEGTGFSVALTALDSGRLGIAAVAIGLAQAALDAAVAYAQGREQFGGPIAGLQGIEFLLADMATGIAAGRALYRRAADLKDAGAPFSTEASMAKLFCSDVAMRVTIDAVQVHGGYGYIEDYPVERYLREAKALQIVEGTNQIQRLVIGRRLVARP
ncbi:MAG TPA: acyl-CoA dehydrogenase family protein [Actinomycetota bacterium]|nr:acyl-CoA dehydrogenase family protein [Actinomycetota bacterium]